MSQARIEVGAPVVETLQAGAAAECVGAWAG
ncbi:hypothetical protein BTH_I2126 [Burkholderia thailandensis E264]|uniref:Uncharacterized protein n=1 Tax=Burkholderia thailandensis (strain ATCC 700388 / DSM 13276 / CCUG 48851 / CIP 106301 / E264) TaxID=271848 RepID=Q2SWQ1_BURTA|nr:hypothetical protein BTH_I2126 [Burkholderia thailandensis E264]